MFKVYTPAAPIQMHWVTLAGPDAKDFLHRLTTVNVRALEVGQGAKGCFLTPLGRIRASFTLWHYRDAEYAFELDSGASGKWRGDLLATIEQFTFAEQLTVTDTTDAMRTGALATAWIFTESNAELARVLGLEASPDLTTTALDQEIRICNHGARDFGRTWLSAWGRPEQLSQWVNRIGNAPRATFEELEQWRIAAVRPRADVELTETSMPLEIGLWDAIAENKGCYPGQEVIERVVTQGAPPRRLSLIRGKGAAPAPGAAVLNLAEPAGTVGEITSVAEVEGGFAALALLRKIHAKEGMEVRFAQGSHASVVQVAQYALS